MVMLSVFASQANRDQAPTGVVAVIPIVTAKSMKIVVHVERTVISASMNVPKAKCATLIVPNAWPPGRISVPPSKVVVVKISVQRAWFAIPIVGRASMVGQHVMGQISATVSTTIATAASMKISCLAA